MIPEALRETVANICNVLPGWQGSERSLAHMQLILDVQPKCVVEIGVYGGRSLIPQALALKQLGTGKIYGIDPWHKETAVRGVTAEQKATWELTDFDAIHARFMQAVRQYGVEGYVVPVRAKSLDARNLFGFGEIDILHIDGSHEEGDAVADVKAYIPLVKRGGHIWFDDADFKSTQRAVRLLDDGCELERNHGQFRLYRL